MWNPELTYLWSDSHFNHIAILGYEPTRQTHLGASNVEQMNQKLIENALSAVPEHATLIHCGDYAMGKDDFYLKFPFKHILVKGNHDKSHLRMSGQGFDEVYSWQTFYETYGALQVGDLSFVLTHKPLDYEKFPAMDRHTHNIHGHLHSYSSPSPRHICVSVEQINFTPISLQEIVNRVISTKV